jgi:SpoVK/Ycf46/Vps4 family AAA+-type ATPase
MLAGSGGSGDGVGWRVFISHTSELRDFPEGTSYVAAVERAISAAGHVVVDMADFPAADQAPARECAERVRGCDVYVGLLGMQYGSPVRDQPQVSYTELEFDTATEAGLDRLVFLLDEGAVDVRIPPLKLIDREFGDRQDTFRRRVQQGGLTTRSFASPAELGQLVERSLRDLRRANPVIGLAHVGEMPDVSYRDIGGLGAQIEEIRDAIELPYLHADLFRQYGLPPAKGVLLYGPPGCGKSLIAKAVANSLAKQAAAMTGGTIEGFFINIKGPELLNNYVGEAERHIRLVFQRARERASQGMPVLVFFEEMDSIFRTRDSGVSSDPENTIVPQLLSEIDSVAGLENIIVIGATNREDLIGPAILQPGRLDVKIKIDRPDAKAARDIFSKYVRKDLPLHPDDLAEHSGSREATVEAMIQRTVERMYTESEENRFLEVTYANGDKEVLHFKDFISGAVIENIVARAKKIAIKEYLETGKPGLRAAHLLASCVVEFTEAADMPNTTDPDWARISAKKGERIVHIRTLVSGMSRTPAGDSIDAAHTNQDL